MSTYLRELRDREHARKLSRTWAAAQSGRSGLPSQMLRGREGGTGQPTIGTQVPDAGPAGAADPYAISVTTGVQSFAAAGTLASWTGEVAGPVTVGFAPTYPTTTLIIVKPGTYRLDLNHEWATYQGGGSLSVLVNGEVIWGPDSATSSAVFQETVNLGLLQRDDEVTVEIAPTAGTEDGTCVASLVLVEPAAPEAAPDPATAPTEALSTAVATSNTSDLSLSLSAPTDTVDGDVLMFMIGAGTATGIGSSTFAGITPPSGLTEILNTGVLTTSRGRKSHARFFWKRADAADAAGTTTYTFTVSNPGGAAAFGRLLVATLQDRPAGPWFDGVQSEFGADISDPSLSPAWSGPSLVLAMSQYAETTTSSSTEMSLDAPTVTLVSSGGSSSSPRLRLGSASAGQSTVSMSTDLVNVKVLAVLELL